MWGREGAVSAATQSQKRFILETTTLFHNTVEVLHARFHVDTENNKMCTKTGRKPAQITHLMKDISGIY